MSYVKCVSICLKYSQINIMYQYTEKLDKNVYYQTIRNTILDANVGKLCVCDIMFRRSLCILIQGTI